MCTVKCHSHPRLPKDLSPVLWINSIDISQFYRLRLQCFYFGHSSVSNTTNLCGGCDAFTCLTSHCVTKERYSSFLSCSRSLEKSFPPQPFQKTLGWLPFPLPHAQCPVSTAYCMWASFLKCSDIVEYQHFSLYQLYSWNLSIAVEFKIPGFLSVTMKLSMIHIRRLLQEHTQESYIDLSFL